MSRGVSELEHEALAAEARQGNRCGTQTLGFKASMLLFVWLHMREAGLSPMRNWPGPWQPRSTLHPGMGPGMGAVTAFGKLPYTCWGETLPTKPCDRACTETSKILQELLNKSNQTLVSLAHRQHPARTTAEKEGPLAYEQSRANQPFSQQQTLVSTHSKTNQDPKS